MDRFRSIRDYLERPATWSWIAGLAAGLTALYTFIFVIFGSPKPISTAASNQAIDRYLSLENAVTDWRFSLDSMKVIFNEEPDQARLSLEVNRWRDSLSTLYRQVAALSSAITPMNVTEVVTLQRLGDKYDLLIQSLADMKANMEKSQLLTEQMLRDNADRVDAELDRVTPMIYGMLGTVVLIVGQTFLTQRRRGERDGKD